MRALSSRWYFALQRRKVEKILSRGSHQVLYRQPIALGSVFHAGDTAHTCGRVKPAMRSIVLTRVVIENRDWLGEAFPRRQKRNLPHPRLFWNAAKPWRVEFQSY